MRGKKQHTSPLKLVFEHVSTSTQPLAALVTQVSTYYTIEELLLDLFKSPLPPPLSPFGFTDLQMTVTWPIFSLVALGPGISNTEQPTVNPTPQHPPQYLHESVGMTLHNIIPTWGSLLTALIPQHTAGLACTFANLASWGTFFSCWCKAISITAQASTLNIASVPVALKHNVGIKCATITVDEVHVKEFKLKQMQVCDAFCYVRGLT
ncbi:hypothetical protein EI94DRAFT_1797673 [Lactarius quietus]|nr:hypothetical protein EI94DRAFT_1797673 [Lactarius quietus]